MLDVVVIVWPRDDARAVTTTSVAGGMEGVFRASWLHLPSVAPASGGCGGMCPRCRAFFPLIVWHFYPSGGSLMVVARGLLVEYGSAPGGWLELATTAGVLVVCCRLSSLRCRHSGAVGVLSLDCVFE